MWGAFHGVRASAQQMVKQGKGGSIVVVSSPHAVIAIPTAMAYNMAKAAIDHMARTAAIELVDHRIRVNIVHPGWIDTPGERKFFTEEQLAAGGKNLPWKRLGRPEEIGKAVAYVLSDDAEYMTGATLSIDGGVSLPWWSNRAEGADLGVGWDQARRIGPSRSAAGCRGTSTGRRPACRRHSDRRVSRRLRSARGRCRPLGVSSSATAGRSSHAA